jgi:uncharacterized protein
MKKSILTNIYLFIALTFCTASISWSADFQKGLAAAASRDYATALREWTPLAEQGNASAQDWLGWLYLAGFGVPQNYKVAEKWYRLAALQGNVNASYRLADLYDLGENGVRKDLKEATEWFSFAAEHGNTDAQFRLGVQFAEGRGIPQNFIYSYMWFNIAAGTGYFSADFKRDELAKKMNQSQIEKAQDLSLECLRKNYKKC